MPNTLADLKASLQAEGRRRMTHWAPERHDIPRLSLADLGEFAAEAATPYGNYVSGRDAVADFESGHPVSGSVNALLALPGLGLVGAVGRRGKKAVNALLDMSDQARMNRARKMGFDTDTVWYHGTDRMFPAFDDKKLGASTGDSPMGRLSHLGHWATDSEPQAVGFGELAAKKSGQAPVTRRLYASTKGQEVIDFEEAPTDDLLHYVLRRFREGGTRTVRINNLPAEDGRRVSALVTFDPRALRDVDAAFDPKRVNSSNLLASLAALGVAVQTVPNDVELAAEDMRGLK
jgi:hypothetical protein